MKNDSDLNNILVKHITIIVFGIKIFLNDIQIDINSIDYRFLNLS